MGKPLEINQRWLDAIAEQVNGLSYGNVTITVHDGRIVQIDRTERTRYDQSAQRQTSPNGQQPETKPRDIQSSGDSLRAVQ